MDQARGDFADLLVQKRIVTPEQILQARRLQKETGTRLPDVIVQLGFATPEEVTAAVAKFHNLPAINLANMRIPGSVIKLVSEAVAREHVFLPMKEEGGVLTIITSDPTDSDVIEKLWFILNMEIKRVVAPRDQIVEAINRHYGHPATESVKRAKAARKSPAVAAERRLQGYRRRGSVTDTASEFPVLPPIKSGIPAALESSSKLRDQKRRIDLGSRKEIEEAAPVQKLVNLVILCALKDRASDIHFELLEDEYKVSYRSDGVVVDFVPPPRHMAGEIVDRIKFMSGLDLTQRSVRQRGRVGLDIDGTPVELRVTIVPAKFGEKVAIRVLDRTVIRLDLDLTGMEAKALDTLREIIHGPNGIVLFAGPPGAGKTTTLYSTLEELKGLSKRIVTIEDLPEYEIEGMIRFPIHNLSDANALLSLLEQDPDILVVGEIRGREIARVGVQAARSGCMVLGTLDAADAPSSIARLRGLGLEPSLIAATVRGIVVQRLVRKICEECRTEMDPTPEMLVELDLRAGNVYRGRGCHRCNQTGYRGRLGLFELLVVNDSIRDVISEGAATDQLPQACRKLRMTTLREAGLRAVFDGETTIEEVDRETPREDGRRA